jgi:hypothetical protein
MIGVRSGVLQVQPIYVAKGSRMSQETKSVNEIRTAIRELSARAELARKEGRPHDAVELEQRVDGYRQELAAKP